MTVQPEDPRGAVVAPRSFLEDVEDARAHGRIGDLDLLAEETGGFAWQAEGLNHVARALHTLGTVVAAERSGKGADAGDPDVPARNPPTRHVFVFTGHRIDEPERAEPRFPADKEAVAATAIATALDDEIRDAGAIDLAIAGAASGGDLLFHEACRDREITTEVRLTIAQDDYVRTSVAPSGADWVDRFREVADHAERRDALRVLSQDGSLPGWLGRPLDYSIWQRNNLWTLLGGLAEGGQSTVLLALWDRQSQGDGPGGTAHMAAMASERGAKVTVIDTTKIFGLSGPSDTDHRS